MKTLYIITLLIFSTIVSAKEECKQLKSCAEYIGVMTNVKYDLGILEKKTLRKEPSIKMTNSNAEQVFGFILEQNNLFRVRLPDGGFKIIEKKEFDAFKFPKITPNELKATFDYFSFEYDLKNTDIKEMLLLVAKKLVSKNGKVQENAGENRITVIDNGANLVKIAGIFSELDRN